MAEAQGADGSARQPERAIARFLGLYGTLFIAFGVVSPFLALFLSAKGLSPEAIGAALSAGTAIRIVAGPAGGRLADRLRAPRAVLTACIAAAALIGWFYLPVQGSVPLILVSIMQAAALAPIVPLADALAVASAQADRFAYGWVRGAGSAAFILGTLAAGLAVALRGVASIIWLNVGLLATAAWFARRCPDRLRTGIQPALAADGGIPAARRADRYVRRVGVAAAREINKLYQRPVRTERPGSGSAGISALLRIPLYRRIMVTAALIQGSHALHDGFAVIIWTRSGIGSTSSSLLWSLSVGAEVVVFLLLGRPLIERLTPAGACVLAALAGVIRWGILAETTSLWAIALAEPLHGFTFALQHLVCMRLIGRAVPAHLAGTAQAVYNTAAVGTAYALLMLASGWLYAWFGPHAFWVMAGLCAAAIPFAIRLRAPDEARGGPVNGR